MAHQSYDASSEKAKILRKKAGAYIKNLRKDACLTQREVAVALNLDYYTFISQLESGYGRVPPNLYRSLADILEVKCSVFTKEMMRFYDPFTFDAMFHETPKPYVSAEDDELLTKDNKRKTNDQRD